jgi:sulfide:quinone oxidoreductase
VSQSNRIVIVGGGTAGLTVAAQLHRKRRGLELIIVEPSEDHYYQPLWTLVGAGVFPREASRRKEADYIPSGARWVRDYVDRFLPGENQITTRGGETIAYDYLVVCPGIQINWHAIAGLAESLGQNGVCSNYSYDTVGSTWETIRNFRGGTALFTHPVGAVKCGGAPQKICYLAEDHFRRSGIRDKCRVVFCAATPRIFHVEPYASRLETVVARKQIETHFLHDLVELRGAQREAVFQIVGSDERHEFAYDMIHVTPKMGPPDFVAKSPLAGEGGWVDVDKHTLQHKRFANVFALGDASNLPTSKTGAAIRKQAPVLVRNLLHLIDGHGLHDEYSGYTSCPLVTGYGKLILAEFDYDLKPEESFPIDQSKERYSMYLLKKYGLPALYWHGMLRGRA